MQLKFKIQSFQQDAVDAICDVFLGQRKQGLTEYSRDLGSRVTSTQAALDEDEDYDLGYRNSFVDLSDDMLLSNIQRVQRGNNIHISSSVDKSLGAVSLDVEMETGTGKTYVYIKTMFELYELYGWNKYIVVVPSVAIREGVRKTFEITSEHFHHLYGQRARFFVYNSANLHLLDEFSSGHGINVMIINTQAFATSLKEEGRSKESRIIYSRQDSFQSRRPIDVISANRPIVIMDEPQRMQGATTQAALRKHFNVLFTLNFSATHRVTHNLVYVLDALDAFQQKLVKKIEVKGFVLNRLKGTDGYIYFSEIVLSDKKEPRASLEIDCRLSGGEIKRRTRLFGYGDRLLEASGGLTVYGDIYITEVNPFAGTVTFSNGESLSVSEASSNNYEADIRRMQIRETILSHLDKEARLFEHGIKCLSLFFIDEVAKYRQYNSSGEEVLGEYGVIFEEEYLAALNERITQEETPYTSYLKGIAIEATHRGYFSIDRQGRIINSEVKRGQEASDDISAYDLILKNKERLLSFTEPTRFIFSHSALREGWDNPNVFQICTLKQSDSSIAKRQEVGRGLRLSVSQSGERQDSDIWGEQLVQDINMLTVIASESYATFVDDLQKGIAADLYDRPTTASVEFFTGKTVCIDDRVHQISEREARVAYNYLVRNDYLDDEGKVTDAYRTDSKNNSLAPLPESIAPIADGVHTLVRSIYDPSVLKDMVASAKKTAVSNRIVDANWTAFLDLWERINKRYAYLVDFDSEKLIEQAAAAINANLSVTEVSYTRTTGEGFVDFTVTSQKTVSLDRSTAISVKYDLAQKISDGVNLSRRTVVAILQRLKPDKMMMFAANPEEFSSKVIKEINDRKAAIVVQAITYVPSGEEDYTREIFNVSKSSEEYQRAYEATKGIQQYIFVDGAAGAESIEGKFARDLDVSEDVIAYAKLPKGPRGFFIPTPLGNYSPDWAISFRKGSVQYIYFIAETKGSMDRTQFRPVENAKIDCAMRLFNEISTTGVKYHFVDSYRTLIDDVMRREL